MIFIGDFNDISNRHEKIGVRQKDQRNIDEFISLQEDLGLGDIGFKRQMYTWSNNR